MWEDALKHSKAADTSRSFIAISGNLNHITLDSDCILPVGYLWTVQQGRTGYWTYCMWMSQSHKELYSDSQAEVTLKTALKQQIGVYHCTTGVYQQIGVYHCQTLTQCLTDYLNLCMDVVWTVCCFPSNKCWVTHKVKAVLNKKNAAGPQGAPHNWESLYSMSLTLAFI